MGEAASGRLRPQHLKRLEAFQHDLETCGWEAEPRHASPRGLRCSLRSAAQHPKDKSQQTKSNGDTGEEGDKAHCLPFQLREPNNQAK
jgi:hypothetical protein